MYTVCILLYILYAMYIVTEKELTDKYKWVLICYSCPGVRETQTLNYSSRIGVTIMKL